MMLPEECQEEPGCPFSASRFQYELLSNLHSIYVDSITSICPIPTLPYPEGRFLVFRRRDRLSSTGIRIISPVFLNWGLLKVMSLVFSVFLTSLITMRKKPKPQLIMLYNPYLGYSLPALLLSRLWRIPAICIVADMPPETTWTLRGFVRQVEAHLQRQVVSLFDGLLTFSIYVAKDLNYNKPFIRIDPGIQESDFEDSQGSQNIDHEHALLFSGVLSERNGLKLLLDAFAQVRDSSLHLWISGRGEMRPYVEDAIKHDPRICFWGFVERCELFKIMQRSTVLVNPRPAGLPEHRYNFPSKIIEYLAVGRPVISTASSDVAQEYGNYLILLDEETPQKFAQLIEAVFTKSEPELDLIGSRGRQYVLAEKNWHVLSRRVYDFLISILEI